MHPKSSRPAAPRVETLETREVPAVLYVDPAGSDGNPGAAGAPFQTIQAAANVVAPGDTVFVRAGTYQGFNLRTSGTADARITFLADPAAPKGAVVVDRPNAWNNRDGINLEGASFVTVEGFKVVNQPRAGLRSVTNQFVVFKNNIADNNGDWGVFTGFSRDLLVENNETSRSQRQHGIYVSNSADRPVVRGNTAWGNAASGIQLNADASQGDDDGIITRALIENNVLRGNGRIGGASINLDGVQESTVRNNLITDAMATGIALFLQDGAEGSRNNLIANNTVLVNNTADVNAGRWAVSISGWSTGTTLVNNILHSTHPGRGAMQVNPNSLPGMISDHNAVEDLFTTDGGALFGLDAWRAGSKMETRSFTIGDPAALFANAAGGDFRLKAGSPAIDTGAALHAPPTDQVGTARTAGAGVDVGAFEVPAPPPTTPARTLQIIDDGRPGYSTSGPGWLTGAGQTPWYSADTDYRLGNKTAAAARWTFDVVPGQSYRVSTTWSALPNRASDATYRVIDANGAVLKTAVVNQEQAPNDLSAQYGWWEDLAGSATPTGKTLTVELDGYGNEYLIADAVRVEQLTDGPTVPPTSPPTTPPPPPADPGSGADFTDDFASAAPKGAWRFVGGAWSQANGMMRQTTTSQGDPFKAIIADRTWSAAQEVEATVRVDSWNPGVWPRAGVGVRTNDQGLGYNLVFRGGNKVQFLNDHVVWGNAYDFAWQVGSSYRFKLRADADGTLRGKVWAAGTAEPATWMFTQTGWTGRTGGSPSLNGGANRDGSSTASFDDVAARNVVTAGPIFADDFTSPTADPRWSHVNGAWARTGGVLQQTNTAVANEKKAVLTGLAAGAATEIEAKVRVDAWTDGIYPRAGVGLGTDAAGLGYNLVFRAGNKVQFLNDRVTWGSSFDFAWQTGTWYTFKLRQEADGTLRGKVWAAGTAEPAGWTFTQTGWGYRAGWASLNGGSAAPGQGTNTASFDDFKVWG